MNKPVCFELSILELSENLVSEFWNDYIKLKYGDRAKLYHTDKESFSVYTKTDDVHDFRHCRIC